MKLLLKFCQYCMQSQEGFDHVASQSLKIQAKLLSRHHCPGKKHFFLSLVSKMTNFDILFFFPVYESEILTDLTVAKCRTTFEMGKKVKQLYHQRSRNLQKFFFSWFSTCLKPDMFNRMGLTSTRFGNLLS